MRFDWTSDFEPALGFMAGQASTQTQTTERRPQMRPPRGRAHRAGAGSRGRAPEKFQHFLNKKPIFLSKMESCLAAGFNPRWHWLLRSMCNRPCLVWLEGNETAKTMEPTGPKPQKSTTDEPWAFLFWSSSLKT